MTGAAKPVVFSWTITYRGPVIRAVVWCMTQEIYRFRYFDSHSDPLTLCSLTNLVCELDPKFSFNNGEISWDNQPRGGFEVLYPGSAEFADHVEHLRNVAKEITTKHGVSCETSMRTLDVASQLVVLTTRWPTSRRLQNEMFEILDPIWDLLMETRKGILNVDYGWFHNSEGHVK